MSKNCVEATVELAQNFRIPLMLIASRRQVEAGEMGSGYVNGWSSESFVQFVRKLDSGGYVVICRDHGGPWQNTWDAQYRVDLSLAMASAKRSFEVDIEAGFDILHLDPSVDVHGEVSQEQVIDRLSELHEHCHSVASRLKKTVAYEFGTEEQATITQDLEVFTQFLQKTTQLCQRNHLPAPTFMVAQTATKVVETRNIGGLDNAFAHRIPGALPAEIEIPKVVETCNQFGVYLKAHNVDYLSNEGISWFPRLGIHSANVAPEFGVGETRHILMLCRDLGLSQEEEQFLQLAYESRKWEKWMLLESTATDRDRAVIAGHYVFSTPEFGEIKARIETQCAAKGLNLDGSIKDYLKVLIGRYLYGFGLVEGRR